MDSKDIFSFVAQHGISTVLLVGLVLYYLKNRQTVIAEIGKSISRNMTCSNHTKRLEKTILMIELDKMKIALKYLGVLVLHEAYVIYTAVEKDDYKLVLRHLKENLWHTIQIQGLDMNKEIQDYYCDKVQPEVSKEFTAKLDEAMKQNGKNPQLFYNFVLSLINSSIENSLNLLERKFLLD